MDADSVVRLAQLGLPGVAALVAVLAFYLIKKEQGLAAKPPDDAAVSSRSTNRRLVLDYGRSGKNEGPRVSAGTYGGTGRRRSAIGLSCTPGLPRTTETARWRRQRDRVRTRSGAEGG